MRTTVLLTALVTLTMTEAAATQEHHPGAFSKSPSPALSPYAGYERRRIKALSNQDVADLRAGRGMGLALAAELNGHPGPLHVLELADKLGLSLEQRSSTAAALAAMKRETVAIGEEVVAAEAELDGLFANRSASIANVDAAVARTASAQGRLRAAHLRYHIGMSALLTYSQIAAYDRLRGYSASGKMSHGD